MRYAACPKIIQERWPLIHHVALLGFSGVTALLLANGQDQEA